MLGFILGAITAGCVCSVVNETKRENDKAIIKSYQARCYQLYHENNYLRLTVKNHSRLLASYDVVNKYAKSQGFRGAVDFFYFLTNNHDNRFGHFARFLNKVRVVRNDVAHNGRVYDIDCNFLNKLDACVKVCNRYKTLPYGRRLRLS